MHNKYRDPIHGFIEVSDLENEIIDSLPFQRLRNIKQLAMTYMVFHGAEHTRFGHSLGVMHVATRAFRAAIENSEFQIDAIKMKYYEQILRLIALTHDLGHAPFSHASESVFPDGLEHEDFTEKIIKETIVGECIKKIGKSFSETYGPQFDITPELICDIYRGRKPGENSEFTLLKTFLDSELDCDKMDYLLRDSYYCGVNYGKFDIERLIKCLIIHKAEGGIPRLAIDIGGVQAFEEFVVARYFMFIQVYFHRTRRFFDIMLVRALRDALENGMYPSDTIEYLKWDDCRIIQLLKDKTDVSEACYNIVHRCVYPRIFRSPTHLNKDAKANFHIIEKSLNEKFGRENFLIDQSAGKMPHKIPMQTEIFDEKAIVIVDSKSGKCTTISDESPVIRSLTDKIDIYRIYAKPDIAENAQKFVKELIS